MSRGSNYFRRLRHSKQLSRVEKMQEPTGRFRKVANKAVRSLVDTVTAMPVERGGLPGIIVRGRLQSLSRLDSFRNGSHFERGTVVPGESIELPTNGLQTRGSKHLSILFH